MEHLDIKEVQIGDQILFGMTRDHVWLGITEVNHDLDAERSEIHTSDGDIYVFNFGCTFRVIRAMELN